MTEDGGQRTAGSDFVSGSAFPFKTQDAVLANCLHVAGIKETDASPVHVYDSEILFKLGNGKRDVSSNKIQKPSRFAGLTPIGAARKAHTDGLRGRVEYHFEHSPLLTPLLAAYKDQVRLIEESEGDAGAAIRDVMRLAAGRLNPGEKVMDEREALLRILCVALKLRIEFVNRWKQAAPVLVVPGTRSTRMEPGGRCVEKYAGGKMVPIYASDETLRRMKLL